MRFEHRQHQIASSVADARADLIRTLRRFKQRKLKPPTRHSFAKLPIKRLSELTTHFDRKRELVIHTRLPEVTLQPRQHYTLLSTERKPYDPADPAIDYHAMITSQIPVQPKLDYILVPDVDAIIEGFWFMHEMIESYCTYGGRDIWLGVSNRVTDYTFRGYWTHLKNSNGGDEAGLQWFNNMFYANAVRLTNLHVDLDTDDSWIINFISETFDSVTEDWPGYKIERALRGF